MDVLQMTADQNYHDEYKDDPNHSCVVCTLITRADLNFPAIYKEKDCRAFFQYLYKPLGLIWHPDTSFDQYVNLESGKRIFDDEACAFLDKAMARCFDILADRIYQVCLAEDIKFQTQVTETHTEALTPEEKPATEPASSRDALAANLPSIVDALTNLVKWMDDSNLSHTAKGGNQHFSYGGDEYLVVTAARKALKNQPLPLADISKMAGGDKFLLQCPECGGDMRHIDTATTMRDVLKVDDLGDGTYIVTMEGLAVIDLESSCDDRLECRSCCKQFAIPENVTLDYE